MDTKIDTPFTEKLEQVDRHPFNNGEVGDQQGEALQEELPQTKRGRRKRLNKNSGRPVSFNCPWELDARLDNYRADRKRKEERIIERTEVIVQALDEFLTREGQPPDSSDS